MCEVARVATGDRFGNGWTSHRSFDQEVTDRGGRTGQRFQAGEVDLQEARGHQFFPDRSGPDPADERGRGATAPAGSAVRPSLTGRSGRAPVPFTFNDPTQG